MTEKDPKQVMAERVEFVKTAIIGQLEHVAKQDDPTPVLCLFADNERSPNVAIMLDAPMNDESAKDGLAMMVARLTAAFVAEAACFVTAAWAVKPPENASEHEMKRAMSVMPSQHPQRVEIVNACYVGTGGATFLTGELDRSGEHPVVTEWDEMLVEGEAKLAGRFPDAMRAGLEAAAEIKEKLPEAIRLAAQDEMAKSLREQFKVVNTEVADG